jgi:ATP-dependent Clp protease ATP-binding subunit ClpC
LGLIREGEGNAVKILRHMEVDLEDLRKMVEGGMEPASSMRPPEKDKITLVKQAEKMLKITFLEAKLFKSPQIDTEHVLLSMLKDPDNLATRALGKFHVDYDGVKHEVETILAGDGPTPAATRPAPKAQGPQSTDDDDDDSGSASYGGAAKKQGDSKSKTPVLDNFGRDLTKWPRTASWTPSWGARRRSSA